MGTMTSSEKRDFMLLKWLLQRIIREQSKQTAFHFIMGGGSVNRYLIRLIFIFIINYINNILEL